MSQSQNPRKSSTVSLVIDGSGAEVFVGVLGQDRCWKANSSTINQEGGAPLESLFPTVQAVLSEAETTLENVSDYIYCEGPGSVLGMRLCAMAIETWTQLYPKARQLRTYNSLQFTAAIALLDHPEVDDALLVSDWKKDTWNAVRINQRSASVVTALGSEELNKWQGQLWHLPQRKGWQKAPETAVRLAYSPARINEVLDRSDLIRETETVDLFASGSNVFKKWIPDRHRIPTS